VQETPSDVEQYLDRVVSALRDDLGPDLIGVYLHGSLAMGAFTPGRSDIDMLAVCAAPLTPERSTGLGKALDAIPRPASGGDLEFSLTTEAAVRAASAAPAFELHVSTHDEPTVVDGHDRPGDEDLVTHFAMARARGRSLFGPDPVEMFPEPDRALLISSMRGDIEWARSSSAAGWEGHDQPQAASMAYQVLNGARCLRFLETGDLGSKAEGAEWLERRDPDPDVHGLLEAALVYQRGGTPDVPDAHTLDAFTERVEKALRLAGARLAHSPSRRNRAFVQSTKPRKGD
jgi:streptomycin 3"-adenylyltransferase